jgi:hypothetical protein
VPDMAEARTYYNYGYNNGLTWGFIRERIGWSLRKRYQVPKELPPNLLALVRKLEAVEGKHGLRTPASRLDVIEGNCLLRYATPVEPRSLGLSDDWLLCT